jgi:hypothetical protein
MTPKRSLCIECGGVYGGHFTGCPEDVDPDEDETQETEDDVQDVEIELEP